METVTVKLERRHVERLKARARATGRSQGAILRDLIDRLDDAGRPSLHEQARDVCGAVKGRRDLSTRRLSGYGRD
jgi:hypothetical protein